MSNNKKLVLASGSRVRASLLEGAGLSFEIQVSPVDEDTLKKIFSGDADALAVHLAIAKAEAVSALRGSDLVIGADQVMSCAGRQYDKPKNLAEARLNLQSLRGKAHTLHSAIAVAENGKTIWQMVAQAHLTVRDFSDIWLDEYLDQVGDRVLSSVGCYQLEGPGVQLFERIEGDYFTILGLPLLPLLEQLRSLGLIRV